MRTREYSPPRFLASPMPLLPPHQPHPRTIYSRANRRLRHRLKRTQKNGRAPGATPSCRRHSPAPPPPRAAAPPPPRPSPVWKGDSACPVLPRTPRDPQIYTFIDLRAQPAQPPAAAPLPTPSPAAVARTSPVGSSAGPASAPPPQPAYTLPRTTTNLLSIPEILLTPLR